MWERQLVIQLVPAQGQKLCCETVEEGHPLHLGDWGRKVS